MRMSLTFLCFIYYRRYEEFRLYFDKFGFIFKKKGNLNEILIISDNIDSTQKADLILEMPVLG